MTVKQFKKLNDIPGIEEHVGSILIFASQKYADYLKGLKNFSTIWFCGYLDEELLYIIPFAYRKKYIFSEGMFLTATIYIKDNSDNTAERDFLNSVIKVVRQEKIIDWIAQPPNWALSRVVPFNSVFCKFGTFKINLEKNSEDYIYSKFHRNTRYEIRKALKNKIVVKKGLENLDDCIIIFKDAAEKNNFIYPTLEEIRELISHFPKNIGVYVAYYNNIPQACNVIIFDRNSSYGLYSATNTNRILGSNYLLFWEIIKDVKKGGTKYFDFVGARINPEPGSKFEKIQLFKKHFGGELIQGFLWKTQINKFKYRIYHYSLKTFYTIKGKKFNDDIIDQEKKKLTVF